jgi:hypothetical protein
MKKVKYFLLRGLLVAQPLLDILVDVATLAILLHND